MRHLRIEVCVLLGLLASGCNDQVSGLIDAGVKPVDSGFVIADAGFDAGVPCVGLHCAVVECGDAGSTTLRGTIYAPNGSLPLFNVNVFVPTTALPTLVHGSGTCEVCDAGLPGAPLTATTSKDDGTFALPNVPVTSDLSVVIQTGKWRKVLRLHAPVTACAETTLPVADTTLPSSRTDLGADVVSADLPQIAIATGSADALECLALKLGISRSEMTTDQQGGRVHFYASSQTAGGGAAKFAAGFDGGAGAFTDSATLWASADSLSKYDLVMLSCEGAQHPETKPQTSLDAMKQYADHGGRVFMTHFHNIWVQSDWPTVASWNTSAPSPGAGISAIVDETSNAHGASFASWLVSVGATPTRDLLPLSGTSARTTCTAVDDNKVSKWLVLDGTHSQGNVGVQNFQFSTPNDGTMAPRCGKVSFSDVHVSGDSVSLPGAGFPTGCASGPLTAQEKALTFLLFELGGCVDAR